MTDSKFSYRQIIKSTSVFGGVQFFTILISLVRTKCIALFAGTVGVGMLGLFTSVLSLIGSCTNLGIETSAVKSIAAAQDNPLQLSREVSILRRLAWITGLFGIVVTAILSPVLSHVTFGNSNFTTAFILLSLSLLLKQLANGEMAILQGLRQLKYLAKVNLYGNLIGLALSVPLYFYYGIAGIVPSLLLTAAAVLLVALRLKPQIHLEKVTLTNRELLTDGKSMIRLGLSLSLITLLTSLSSYLLQIYIGHYGALTEVGLYNAGFTILNTYVGVIFTAMATDYYPRLTMVSHDNGKIAQLVNEQATIAVLLITPIIVLFLALAPNVIRLLYSEEFLPIVPLVCWGIVGMVLKAVSWSMGYILIAKGESRVFIKTSLGFNTVFLLINIAGYSRYGLEGLGITFVINYTLHFLVLLWLTAARYHFTFSAEFYKLFFICLAICILAFASLKLELAVPKWVPTCILIGISFWFSLVQLNKRLHFRDFLSRKSDD